MTITFPKIVKLHFFFLFLLRIVITYIFLIILKSIVLACLLAATTLIFTLSPIVYLIFDFSPVKGPEGNIEYLCYIEKNDDATVADYDVISVVDASYKALKEGVQ